MVLSSFSIALSIARANTYFVRSLCVKSRNKYLPMKKASVAPSVAPKTVVEPIKNAQSTSLVAVVNAMPPPIVRTVPGIQITAQTA